MSEKYKVGDRVRECNINTPLDLIAIDGDWAWTTASGYVARRVSLASLTRIEPDVPQPKFGVGQSVTINGVAIGTVAAINHETRFTYDVDSSGQSTTRNVEEYRLEAVPEVCPEVCPECGKERDD